MMMNSAVVGVDIKFYAFILTSVGAGIICRSVVSRLNDGLSVRIICLIVHVCSVVHATQFALTVCRSISKGRTHLLSFLIRLS